MSSTKIFQAKTKTTNLKQDFTIFTKNLAKNIIYSMIYSYYSLCLNTKKEPYKKIIFVLGHPRSGSSLLTNILISSPEILGYGESHLQYQTEDDLAKLAAKIHWKLRKPLISDEDILLDKLLFTPQLPNLELLKSKKVYKIFLVREPRKALPSIINFRISFFNNPKEEEALKSYLNRLSVLENYAKVINSKNQSLFLTHEQLINYSDLVLEKLQKFLELKQPLSKEYKILPTTGKIGYGDWSDNIKTGKLLKNSQSSGSEIKISSESIEEGLRTFYQCCNLLSQYCTTI